jgi:hypothetical protein
MESKTSGAMTCPTKRQRRGKAQRASGAKTFNSGFVEILLEVSHDPDYQPNREPETEEASDHNLSPRHGLALSPMPADAPENSDSYDGSGEESESDVRKRRNISEAFEDTLRKSKEALTRNDSMEVSTHPSPSAAAVSKNWLEVHIPVCVDRYLEYQTLFMTWSRKTNL